ncbi:hypothetical protein [Adhaeretor mobilis]|uniref:Uncharacterized protein n=1 Tax=Adhaeretor mobilis TaxID=1930276 RepID=A0A517MS81_9BACT|nr:hypothetical protein [Adhaeretor mobilis]QDS97742.1 hypothetical protein HG15A2_10090 [Adhaeretor mobilis]
MLWLAKLLILSALAAPTASNARQTDAVPIFYCDFGDQWDVNFDHWPDRWTRVTGPDLPHYIEAALVKEQTAKGGRTLTIRANGGNARAESPLVAVSSKFGYVAEARIRVEGMQYARARVNLEFCDDQQQVIQTAYGEWLRRTDDWLVARIDRVNPDDQQIQYARFVLQLEEGPRADLQGTVSLDDVWLARQPKMVVSTNSPSNVYTGLNNVEITCELSGIREQDPEILFELLDASSLSLSNDRIQLEGRLITNEVHKASDFFHPGTDTEASYIGKTTWRPEITDYGFYRVRVTMRTKKGRLDEHMVTLAIAPPLERPDVGEFGWSLANGPTPLDFEELGVLLPQVAVNWVKLPVWLSANDPSALDELVIFTEQLSAKDIETVAVLDRPSRNVTLPSELSETVSIADALSGESSSWLPTLDPILTRLSLRVRWWQLGNDHDWSFSGLPDLEAELAILRESLFRFGQDVKLGIGWKWMIAQSSSKLATWEFQQYSASPALTGQEIGEYLSLPKRTGVNRWVLIEPLPEQEYDLETRVRDLVEQMLAAKIHGAQAAFVAYPFDKHRGLMTPQGTPGELLLPWRTTASLLSGAQFLGSLQLPGGSENRIFMTPQNDVVMVVWSEHPTQEVIHLGDEVREVDVWGREHVPAQQGHRQVLEVSTLPKFVRGLNSAIARWRMSVKFTEIHVPSVFGKAHENRVEFRNYFRQGVGGSLTLATPKGWKVGPHELDYKVGAGSLERKQFDLTLPFDANSGSSDVRLDFQLSSDKDYQFSVYRQLAVGDGSISLDVASRLDRDGHLIIEQRMANDSEKLVDFKCLLFAPGHRRQRIHVFQLGASEDLQVYRLKDGANLIGKEIWLRAEEVDGSRVLNHRFVAEP